MGRARVSHFEMRTVAVLLMAWATVSVSGCDRRADSGSLDAGVATEQLTAAHRQQVNSALIAGHAAYAAGELRIDLDGDGRKEYSRLVDSRGRTTRQEIDVNGDGRADLIWDFASRPMSFWADQNFDGLVDETMLVSPSIRRGGLVGVVQRRFSVDSTRPYSERSYTVVEAVPTSFTPVRTPGDGNYSAMANLTVAHKERSRYPIVFAGGATACEKDQAALIEAAFDSAFSDGYNCLAAVDGALASRFLATVELAKSVIIECAPASSNECGETSFVLDHSASLGADLTVGITLFNDAFTDPACGSLANTVFHEILHYTLSPGGIHDTDDSYNDPQDQVTACAGMCFPSLKRPVTTLTCAACLQTFNGDARCLDKAPEACPADAHCAYCPCDDPSKTDNSSWFATMDECNTACTESPSCAHTQCIPRPLAPCCR